MNFAQLRQRGNLLPKGIRKEDVLERNVMGELSMYRQSGTKPNFSEIGRRHGMSRKTVARYWRSGGDLDDGRSARGSGFDGLREVIEAKAKLPGVTKKAVHEYLLHMHPDAGLPGYNAFTEYCRKHGIAFGAQRAQDAHPRFETPPGRQLQFDWKEDVRMVDANGEVFEFNVFSATLGYSRLHKFTYSATRATDDLLACLLDAFRFMGGVPQECLTDNMSSLVSMSTGRRVRNERAWRFAKEAGFDLQLCRVGTPQTKGKDESANRFLNRLLAYDRDFVGLDGLLAAIARIEARSNSEPNDTTGLPPSALFMKEKEYLQPIGNAALLESMVGDSTVQVVPPTMLVRAAGRQWSVPRRCIGSKARVVTMPGGQIRITVAGELVAVHDATQGTSKINYTEDHYVEAMEGKAWAADEDIRGQARANLELLGQMGGE